MAYIEFSGVEKRYGNFQAVSRFDLTVEKGEMIALLGPSGCGKTTTLRMLAGFVPVSAGTMRVDGRDITREPPYRRNMGMVFQGYALFPHMTVARNIAFGLEMRGVPASEITARVIEALDRVRLHDFAERLPRQLSGGQQQRVALARAMAINPDVLLLDEPLSALDARLRHEVRAEIRQLQRATGLTTLIVTHDQDEALSMADRLVVMSKGCIEQIGSPADLYERPCNRFVADFMGRSNFLGGKLDGDGRFLTDHGVALNFDGAIPNDASTLSFRPERTRLVAPDALGASATDGSTNTLAGTIVSFAYLGPVIECQVQVDDGPTVMALLTNTVDPARLGMHEGSRIGVQWSRRDTTLLA
ncbi:MULTISPECIES: ABC transporter ATP-binding protein [Paraburkholderia]|uniref:ABC transporter ATP-binding protein n=1 Tax=Paraburkholderia podalyriae TaxID=1938811 RepID=A0ABR7PSR6_9BURK|nr:ABC transporter ATP-binding protein [Paraburkholderia podalyriae]MBC8749283.1 ABC transporter ATP-binding protein [Paraburkholderia podalyriae]